MAAPDVDLTTSGRQLVVDALAIGVSTLGFGFVQGLSARGAGLNLCIGLIAAVVLVALARAPGVAGLPG